MKNKSIITTLALIIVAFTFTSCDKENLTPTAAFADSESQRVEILGDLGLPSSIINEPETNTLVPEIGGITVNMAVCPNGGYSLRAQSDQLDILNGDYTILWYKNSDVEVFSEGITSGCICGTGMRVEVYDSEGNMSASYTLDVTSC